MAPELWHRRGNTLGLMWCPSIVEGPLEVLPPCTVRGRALDNLAEIALLDSGKVYAQLLLLLWVIFRAGTKVSQPASTPAGG